LTWREAGATAVIALFLVACMAVGYRQQLNDLIIGHEVKIEQKNQTIKVKNNELRELRDIKKQLIIQKNKLEKNNETLNKDRERLEKELQAKKAKEAESRKRYASGVTTNRGSSGSGVLASWYGPGLYGNRTASGIVYTASTWGVAHKSLPFGTPVKITHNGITVTAPVVDRGPYTPGREFDLTNAVAKHIGFSGVQRIQVSY